MTVEEVKKIIIPILEKSAVAYAGIFGSVARGVATKNSDVDILVKFSGAPTFDAYIKLDEDLRNSLGGDVDLITEGAVNKFMRPEIERDFKLIYGKR
jgi:predicted nucleotidyltransferase